MTMNFKELEDTGVSGPVGEIPRRLRQYYETVQEEAIPARFLDLLEKLDQAERAALQGSVTVPSDKEVK